MQSCSVSSKVAYSWFSSRNASPKLLVAPKVAPQSTSASFVSHWPQLFLSPQHTSSRVCSPHLLAFGQYGFSKATDVDTVWCRTPKRCCPLPSHVSKETGEKVGWGGVGPVYSHTHAYAYKDIPTLSRGQLGSQVLPCGEFQATGSGASLQAEGTGFSALKRTSPSIPGA